MRIDINATPFTAAVAYRLGSGIGDALMNGKPAQKPVPAPMSGPPPGWYSSPYTPKQRIPMSFYLFFGVIWLFIAAVIFIAVGLPVSWIIELLRQQ